MAERRGLRRLPAAVWIKLGALGLGATALLLLGPTLAREGTQPPVALLLMIGLLLITAAGGAIYGAVRTDLGFPAMVAWYAVGFQALIILVKFVFGPFGLYEVNRSVEFQAVFGSLSDLGGAALAATTVLFLYVAGYLLVYRVATRADRPSLIERMRDRVVRKRRTVLLIVAGSILVAATGGIGIIFGTLLLASGGLQYIDFVFSSTASLLVAMFLATAAVLAGLHFREARASEALIVDAAGVASLLWLGLCFIALYHVLWVVYILVLTSIWPLRTVVPK